MSKHHALILQLLNDPRFRITKNGEVWKFIKSSSIWKRVDGPDMGYYRVYYKDSGLLSHRVVYQHFFGDLSDEMVINHKNGNKRDNSPCNLEQITMGANNRHAIEIGLKQKSGDQDRLRRKATKLLDFLKTNPGNSKSAVDAFLSDVFGFLGL
jgi:hypothetical protein